MRHLILFSAILFGLFNCAPKNYDKPKNLIDKTDMIDIMTDLYINQQGIQFFPKPNEDMNLNLAKGAVHIMKKHNVTYHDFSESYKYYTMQPEGFNEMLNDVKANLEDKLSKEEKERLKNQQTGLKQTDLQKGQ